MIITSSHLHLSLDKQCWDCSHYNILVLVLKYFMLLKESDRKIDRENYRLKINKEISLLYYSLNNRHLTELYVKG